MSGTHFYLTLPRNASMDVFPDNKIGSYHVKFPQTFDLIGEWEVGLYSISYPNTWYTLQNHQNHIYYSTDGGKTFWSSGIVDYGYYTSVPELIKSINAAMKKELKNNNITFSFNPRTHKVKVTLAPKHYIALYGQMAKILGFGGGGDDLKILKSKESPYVAELHSITSIYVYCNIVQPQIVGNTMIPLPRTIPVSETRAMSLRKRLLTFSTCPCRQSLSKTSKSF